VKKEIAELKSKICAIFTQHSASPVTAESVPAQQPQIPPIRQLKSMICAGASESHRLMLEILTLKWGSLENSRKVKELKRVKDRNTRAERKALRHPETGYKRHCLWMDKSSQKDTNRHMLLAYAYLRGRPYLQQERKTKEPPQIDEITYHLRNVGVEVTATQIQEWIKGGPQTAQAA
jgi:hypothetical protein